ncbi:MAG: hypothetical protein DF168_00530 [Candidatus Moanabacter tarae]|uniref:Biopolymer transport protein ExbD n=1 Tax=Candidatus Moanibacter tarae TaxID=2200854 RepID=A0A2Z4ADB3_9BACT|nr:MAG: hypothetical protein DF168_00530 [Candidatus Moanabacter tarae]|tara:strand:+ start:15472 stop:15927 length:456 start_codon:yes stop_codon:yes gene_type:complete
MITSPLDLRRHLSEIDQRFDFVPFVDLILLGLFSVILGSRFIFAPGLDVELPKVDSEVLSILPTAAVLTIRENEMILFEGDRVRIGGLEQKLGEYMTEKKIDKTILLVKADQGVKVRILLEIMDLARRSGFSRVQIAAEEKVSTADFLSTN